MQTFSNMRRSSFNYRVINPTYIIFGLSLLYALLSSMFFYLTPLIGLSFYYLLEHFEDENHSLESLLIFLYILLVEINRGLILFSFFIFFMIFYKVAKKTIKESIACKWCLPIIYVTIGYIGYFLFNLFISNIFNLQTPNFGIGYIVFIITDTILAYILL